MAAATAAHVAAAAAASASQLDEAAAGAEGADEAAPGTALRLVSSLLCRFLLFSLSFFLLCFVDFLRFFSLCVSFADLSLCFLLRLRLCRSSASDESLDDEEVEDGIALCVSGVACADSQSV